jgi:hypothetical protein
LHTAFTLCAMSYAFFIEACSHDWSAFTGADEDRAAQIRSYT